ncbi:MAG: gluconate 2-dehydrogenase subunit 3 family protein [Bryobacteraceae bacterium]
MRRREFLTLPAKGVGGLLIYTLAGEPVRVNAQEGSLKIPLKFFTEHEARTVMAASERILPADESGPGATEANVVVYIDRQLAGPYGRDKFRYTKAPWIESVPEHGYQGKETPRELYRAGVVRLGQDFAQLAASEQDKRLMEIEKTYFFQMLRTHTIEGFLCDPLHGGNAGMIGWQMIGFPGPLMGYREEVEKHGVPFQRKPKSLSQVYGRPVKGWEEEPA